MRRLLYFVARLILLSVPAVSYGQATCYEYMVGAFYGGDTDGPWASSPDLAAELKLAQCQSNKDACLGLSGGSTCATGVYSSCTVTKAGSVVLGVPPAFTAPSPLFQYSYSVGGGSASGNLPGGVTYRVKTTPGCGDAQCPTAGTKKTAVYPDGTSAGTTMCSPRGGGCQATVGTDGSHMIMAGGVSTVGTATYNGFACVYATSPSPASDASAVGQGGNVGEMRNGCGYVNGEGVCPSAPDKGCHFFPSGGSICVADTPDATPPDTGTPGTPATPIATMTQNPSGNTYNWYTAAQIAASSVPVTGSTGGTGGGPLGGDLGDPDGTCVGEDCPTEGDESASGGGDCAAPPSCDGDAIDCALLTQAWLQRCPGDVSEGEITAAVGEASEFEPEEHDMADVLSEDLVTGGAASCPDAPSFSWNGNTISIPWITSICDLFAMLAPVVMLCAYCAAGVILLGGVTR